MNRCLLVLWIMAPAITGAGSPVDWRVSGTEHFDITYPPELAVQVERLGRRAEHAYRQLSSDLGHDLSLRPLLVLFGTRGDLDRAVASRTVPGNREHILLPLDAPTARVDGDLAHELAHVFAFDIVPSLDRREAPPWIQEGLAELERGGWNASDLDALRQMLRMNALPRLSRLRAGSLPGEARTNHIVGHAAFDYLSSRAGRGARKRFLLSLRESSSADPTDLYLAALGLSADDFDRGFDAYLRARFLRQP